MAKIPTTISTERITTQAPAARQTGGVFSTEVAKASQEFAQTAAKVARSFEEAQTLKETTDAVTFSKRRISEIQLEAEETDDIFNVNAFKEKISKVKEEAAKGITLPQARQDFGRAFDRDAIVADFNIRGILRRRQVDAMKTTMLENIEVLKDNSLNREAELTALLAKNVHNRIITGEQAFNLKKATLKDWQKSDILNAIATDATLAKQDIMKGNFGELSASEVADWLEAADKQIEQNKKIAEKQHDEKWLANGGDLIATLEEKSVAQIIKMIANDEINPDLGNDLIKWKTDPASVQYETDKKIWLELAEDSVSPELNLIKFQNQIGRTVADKKIQATEAAELSVQVKALFEQAIKFKSQPNAYIRALQSMMFGMGQWARSVTGAHLALEFRMIKELLRRAQGGESSPEQIKSIGDEIIKEETKSLNSNVIKADEKGTIMIDAYGNRARVYPDGRIEEIE